MLIGLGMHLEAVTLKWRRYKSGKYEGETPLLRAAQDGIFDVTLELVENGAHVNRVDDDGHNALTFTAWSGAG